MVSQRGLFSVFDGTNWSEHQLIGDKVGRVDGISCPADGVCTIVTSNDHAFVYFNDVWTRSGPLGSGYYNDVSCPTSTFCTAVADDGYAVTYRG